MVLYLDTQNVPGKTERKDIGQERDRHDNPSCGSRIHDSEKSRRGPINVKNNEDRNQIHDVLLESFCCGHGQNFFADLDLIADHLRRMIDDRNDLTAASLGNPENTGKIFDIIQTGAEREFIHGFFDRDIHVDEMGHVTEFTDNHSCFSVQKLQFANAFIQCIFHGIPGTQGSCKNRKSFPELKQELPFSCRDQILLFIKGIIQNKRNEQEKDKNIPVKDIGDRGRNPESLCGKKKPFGCRQMIDIIIRNIRSFFTAVQGRLKKVFLCF